VILGEPVTQGIELTNIPGGGPPTPFPPPPPPPPVNRNFSGVTLREGRVGALRRRTSSAPLTTPSWRQAGRAVSEGPARNRTAFLKSTLEGASNSGGDSPASNQEKMRTPGARKRTPLGGAARPQGWPGDRRGARRGPSGDEGAWRFDGVTLALPSGSRRRLPCSRPMRMQTKGVGGGRCTSRREFSDVGIRRGSLAAKHLKPA